MKAIILVGGYGTRLRPLTFSAPKPMVPFANKPIVVHQIEALAAAGVTDIVLAVNYQPEAMVAFLKTLEAKYSIRIHVSQETEPLGTAGPIALAREYLCKDDSPFFMFNSDVTCTFPLKELLAFHRAHGKEGTILTTRVTDPSKYGVVVSDAETGAIQRFVEKPQTWVGDRINAGIYLLNPSVVSRIQPRPTSIEREVFPVMAGAGELYDMLLPDYWMDIGQPHDYLKGLVLHLAAAGGVNADEKKELEVRYPGVTFKGHVLIAPSAKIAAGAVIGPDVTIGDDAVIGAGVRLQRSAIFDFVRVADHALVRNSIVGWESTIGAWAHLDRCVLGKDVQVGAEVVLLGATVCPHKGIKDDITKDEVVL